MHNTVISLLGCASLWDGPRLEGRKPRIKTPSFHNSLARICGGPPACPSGRSYWVILRRGPVPSLQFFHTAPPPELPAQGQADQLLTLTSFGVEIRGPGLLSRPYPCPQDPGLAVVRSSSAAAAPLPPCAAAPPLLRAWTLFPPPPFRYLPLTDWV